MKKRIEDLKITANHRLADSFFVIKVSSSAPMREIMPGQFVQIRIADSPSTFLRRPFSVHDIDEPSNAISFLIQVVGEGTQRLSELQPGEKLNMIYPLGSSFTLPKKGDRVLLMGGGTGIAPLLFLGRKISEAGIMPQFALGFRNSTRIIEHDEFKKLGEVYLATEDGSAGYKGFVTGMSVFRKREWDRIYCCGPEAMMKTVASECSRRDIFCEVSLENLMACGIGICLCCVVPTTRGNLCTCTDGPVFNIRDLRWLT
jgi:dihydroorotate dehydrogenase electron transfer subunit